MKNRVDVFSKVRNAARRTAKEWGGRRDMGI